MTATFSPYVQRALEAGTASGHIATLRVDGTLGDRIVADRSMVEPTECEYCGVSDAEGFVIVELPDGELLCSFCATDTNLGACGHSRTCDCLAGIC